MDDKSNENQQNVNTDDKYQSDGFEEIERRSGEESEFTEEQVEEKKPEQLQLQQQKEEAKVSIQLASTITNTNGNTNTNNNTVINTNVNQKRISAKFEEGPQAKAKIKRVSKKYKTETYKANKSLKEQPQLILESITLQSKLMRLKEENSFVKLEKEKIVKIKNNEILILQEKISDLSHNVSHLSKEIEKLNTQVSDNKLKVYDYDNTINRLKIITNHNDKLKSNNDSLMKVVEALKQDRLDLSSKLETFKAENSTIKQEKMYLLKKTMTQSELIKSFTTKNESNDKEINELKEERTKLINKLTSKDIEVERVFRSSLERESNKTKEKYNKEITELKESYSQLLIDKTKYINDHCDELQQRIYSYEKSLKDKANQIDFLSIELNNKKSINEVENDNLKLQLKMKSEDINRLTTLYNESVQLVELNHKEICKLKEKYEIIRNELIEKESKLQKEITSYKSKWVYEREKNDDYVQLESELDKVICDSSLISTADQHSIDLMKRLNALPMNNKKRISQCIILANKVKYLIIDNDNLRNMNNLLNIENDKIKDERNAFESIGIKIKEPSEFLIIKLQDKEKEISYLQSIINEREKSISAVIQDNKKLEEKAKQIENDLKTILMNRKHLENLELIVEDHIEEERRKWELMEWQKQQFELMNKKQQKSQSTNSFKVSNSSQQSHKIN